MADDSPERELDTDVLVENYSRVVGHSNVAGGVRTSHKTPRREVRWKLDKCAPFRGLLGLRFGVLNRLPPASYYSVTS